MSNEASGQWPEGDRRRALRVGIGATVHFRGDAEWAGPHDTADVSTTGAFVVTETPPPRGIMVSLDLELDGDVAIEELDALVVHVRLDASEASARGCGLMFLRVGREKADRLRALLEARRDQIGS